MKIILRDHHLAIMASWFTDLSAGWFMSLFGLTNPLLLTISIILFILSLLLAFELERLHTHV